MLITQSLQTMAHSLKIVNFISAYCFFSCRFPYTSGDAGFSNEGVDHIVFGIRAYPGMYTIAACSLVAILFMCSILLKSLHKVSVLINKFLYRICNVDVAHLWVANREFWMIIMSNDLKVLNAFSFNVNFQHF